MNRTNKIVKLEKMMVEKDIDKYFEDHPKYEFVGCSANPYRQELKNKDEMIICEPHKHILRHVYRRYSKQYIDDLNKFKDIANENEDYFYIDFYNKYLT